MIKIEDIYNEFRMLDETEALALGGSRAAGRSDTKSDYDLYVYVTKDIEYCSREKLLSPFCKIMEIGNTYWENEDNVVLKDDIHVDIIYRKYDNIERYISYVVDECHAMNGYTTCFYDNIKMCDIIFDKTGRLTALRDKCRREYPQALKKAIIEKNMKLLHGYLPSYDKQITKAYERHDFVSINHRVTGFLASYFDVIFALNEMTHPGEKRLIQICRSECKILPDKFESNIIGLFEYMFKYDVSDILESMVDELNKVIKKHNSQD